MDGGYPRGVGACWPIYDAVRNSPGAGPGEPKSGAPLRIAHLMPASVLGKLSGRRTMSFLLFFQTESPEASGRILPVVLGAGPTAMEISTYAWVFA